MGRYYIDVTSKDTFWFETLCKEAGVELEAQNQPDGATRYFFAETFAPKAWEILNIPEAKRPQERKASLFDQIGGAEKKKQVPSNVFAQESTAAEAECEADKEQLTAIENRLDPPTDVENRWAEETLVEELKQIQSETEETNVSLQSGKNSTAEADAKQRKQRQRKSKGRTHQIMTRLTDAELAQFHRRVKRSGLAQGDFLRNAALNGQIVIEDRSVADVAMLDELAVIRAELGRQGGLLKMIIKPNEGQRALAPEEWDELIGAVRDMVRDMERMKKRLSDLEVRVQHGHCKAYLSDQDWK